MNKQKQIAQIATILSQYNKQQVVEYIQQMEELETREFTLRKTAQNIHKTIVDKKMNVHKVYPFLRIISR